MNFLKTLNKLIEGILWLYLPLVLIYWTLTPIEFSFFKGIKGLLSVFIEPLLLSLDSNFDFILSFEGSDISYTPLILAGVILICIILTIFNAKLLDFIEDSFLQLKIKMNQKALQKDREKKHQSFYEELEKYKIIYLMLKIIKTQKHEEYLVKKEDNAFSDGLIGSYQTSIANLAEKFSGKPYKDFDAGSDTYSFVFTDLEGVLQYIKVLSQRIKEINKGTSDLNCVFNYEIAASCSYSLISADADLSVTSKVLKLCSNSEILITETLKNKIQNSDKTFKVKLEPKGIYMLGESQVDVHRLKVL